MDGHSAIMESLREMGYRLTPQRTLIVSIVYESQGHITAEEIHRRVVQQYPYVDISTVYRTLQLLKKLHLVSETNLGGERIQYELSGDEPHHHLICHHCDGTEALDDEVIEPLRAKLAERHGFQADMEHFAIFGLCRACQAKQSREAGP